MKRRMFLDSILPSAVLIAQGGGRAEAKTICADGVEPQITLSPAEKQRHEIFMLCAFGLVNKTWSLSSKMKFMAGIFDKDRPADDYCFDRGHNIGALVVDFEGNIIGWGVNTSLASNSSFEHAEVRAMRMATAKLNSRNPPSDIGSKQSYFRMFRECIVYTTLESCAQCSGVLALSYVKSVVFGQDDPTQSQIGNILFTLSHQPNAQYAPRPMRASRFLDSAGGLDKVYKVYTNSAGVSDQNGQIHFLNSAMAFNYFNDAAHKLSAMTAQQVSPENASSLANAQTLLRTITSTQC